MTREEMLRLLNIISLEVRTVEKEKAVDMAIELLKEPKHVEWIDEYTGAKRYWCKFRSEKNCDFCSFHSECDIHWKEGDEK